MKYDYYIDHYEVEIKEFLSEEYKENGPILITTDKFNAEEKAVEYARKMLNEGKIVTVRRIQYLEGWAE